MKKTFIIITSLFIVISCSDSSTDTKDTDKKSADTVVTVPPAEVKDPEVEKGLGLIAKSDCFACHKLTEASIGPAYSIVAAKYMGQANIIDTLAQKIIKGGSGKWGTAQMAPHPQFSIEEAKAMAHYVMSIK